MSKKVLIGIGVVGILIIVGVGAYVLRPTAEASAPIEAVPVEVEESAAQESDDASVKSGSAEDQTGMAVPESNNVDEMIVVDEPVEEVDTSTSDNFIVFSIVAAESEVRFTLDELLSGVPTTVVGATDQVAGEIAVDPTAPANSKVGVIQVNARTFATDNNFRNRAINNEILETDEFEFVRFTPTTVTGFPENPAVGEALEFQITGNLTIRDITSEVTFDVTVSAVSETRLEGSASTMVAREDYNLRIPNVPRVADVDEEVLLEIDFVAVRK
ncbi:YceI family protein [Chloroflexota bacterium]